jgi:hypothetical protein
VRLIVPGFHTFVMLRTARRMAKIIAKNSPILKISPTMFIS